MPRLVCFELTPGSRMYIRDNLYTIQKVDGPQVTLQRSDGSAPPELRSWDELAGLVVLEKARLLDALDRQSPPDRSGSDDSKKKEADPLRANSMP